MDLRFGVRYPSLSRRLAHDAARAALRRDGDRTPPGSKTRPLSCIAFVILLMGVFWTCIFYVAGVVLHAWIGLF